MSPLGGHDAGRDSMHQVRQHATDGGLIGRDARTTCDPARTPDPVLGPSVYPDQRLNNLSISLLRGVQIYFDLFWSGC